MTSDPTPDTAPIAYQTWLRSREGQTLCSYTTNPNWATVEAAFAAGQRANESELKEVREKLFLEIRGLVDGPIAEDARLWDMVDFLRDAAIEEGRHRGRMED